MQKILRKINVQRVLFITLAAALLLGTIYWSHFNKDINLYLSNMQNDMASSTTAFLAVVREQRSEVAKITRENENLTGLLTAEQKKRLELERIKHNNEKEIDTLVKLTTFDPELLKKYSKVYFLSENYIPPKLKDVDSTYLVDPLKSVQILDNVYPFLTDLLKSAEKDNVSILVLSAYRSFEYQKTLKSEYKVIFGAGTANQFSAEQGYSEHQLGTAVDFATPDVRTASIAFEKTPANKWLVDNGYKYGFVISYPKANSYYQYEPWHWRFVGKELAKSLHDSGKYFYEVDQREIDGYLIKIFD